MRNSGRSSDTRARAADAPFCCLCLQESGLSAAAFQATVGVGGVGDRASWENEREKDSRGHHQGQRRKSEVLPPGLPQLLTLGKVSTSPRCQEDMSGLG